MEFFWLDSGEDRKTGTEPFDFRTKCLDCLISSSHRTVDVIAPVRVLGLESLEVVHVLLADGTKPDLDKFMKKVVPASLAANGALPAPANVETMVRDVAIPMCKRAFIYNQGALPLSLRVRANPNSATSAKDTGHERYLGRTNDGWTFWSHFITQYPNATVEFFEDTHEVLQDRLLRGSIDVAFMYDVGIDHRLDALDGMLSAQVLQNAFLLLKSGVAHVQPQQEPIELGLGQGKGALVLDGVLGGQHQKRPWQPSRLAIDRHLIFAHGLQQGRLGAGGGAVDLICQQHIHKGRPGPKLEIGGLLVKDRYAGYIGGQ